MEGRSSSRARSARLAVSTSCFIAERPTSSAGAAHLGRMMPVAEAAPSATTSRTTRGWRRRCP